MKHYLWIELTFILTGNVILIGLIAGDIKGLPNPLGFLRLGLGLLYVLFLPGYTLQALLFPQKRDLNNVERIGMSLGLSGAVIALLALLLHYLPWGITLWSIVISLSLFIIVCAILATIRRIRLPAWERFEPNMSFSLRRWWTKQEKGNRAVLIILGITLTMASLTAFSILVMPQPADRFTEFYILNQDGMAEYYPYEVTAGEMVTVTAGIVNNEGEASAYNLQIVNDDQVLGRFGPLLIQNGDTNEQPYTFSIPETGDNQLIKFNLEREGQPSPYRTLRLWINVKPAKEP